MLPSGFVLYCLFFSRLYDSICSKFEDRAKFHLTNIVKASDLITATSEGHYQLKRNSPKPWDKDFVPPKSVPDILEFGTCPWYAPEPNDVDYVNAKNESYILHKLCYSLEYLLLNVDVFYPKHTLVPFMLHALPKIKSFGNITLVHALRMIR